MRRVLSIVLLAATAAVCLCCNGKGKAPQAERETDSLKGDTPELALPDVPVTLTDPADRAEYILLHFWDAMDFQDTARSHDRMFLEQNFVNFLSLFPHVSRETLPAGVGRLLERAVTDSVAFSFVTDIAEHYLDDPNSPARDEEYFMIFLEETLRLPSIPEEQRIRPTQLLQTARKNRPGMIAADFSYITREGRRNTLRGTTVPAGRMLLIFYDPACDHCTEILEYIQQSPIITSLTDSGDLYVLAVYTEGDRALWEKTKEDMPQTWHVAYDLSGIVEHDLYSLPAMPVIYLLGSNKEVLLKDPTPADLERML